MENTDINNLEILQQSFSNLEGIYNRWNETDLSRIDKIHQVFEGEIAKGTIQKIYSIITAEYTILPERNMDELIKRVQVQFQNPLDSETAAKVLNIIIFGTEDVSEDDLVSQQIKLNHGLGQNTAVGDEVENASGKFGFDITNPIPLQGIDKINDYFAKLKLITGESISNNRIASEQSESLPFPVDKYEIFNSEKQSVAIIYVYAYHGNNTNKAPDGFLLID